MDTRVKPAYDAEVSLRGAEAPKQSRDFAVETIWIASRASTNQSSWPGLTGHPSLFARGFFAKKMDTRVKPAYDAEVSLVQSSAALMHRVQRLRRSGRRGGSGQGRIRIACSGFEAFALPLLHVGFIFRRAAPGRHIRRQAAGPLRQCIAHTGRKLLVDGRASAQGNACKRKSKDRGDMVDADWHRRNV